MKIVAYFGVNMLVYSRGEFWSRIEETIYLDIEYRLGSFEKRDLCLSSVFGRDREVGSWEELQSDFQVLLYEE